MERPKVTFTIDKNILIELDSIGKELGQKKSHIVEQALDMLPDTPFTYKLPARLKLPEGEVYQRIESSKGEAGVFLVSDGSDKPYRLHWRAPSYINLGALDKMCRGHKLADIVAILGSLDVVLGEVDR